MDCGKCQNEHTFRLKNLDEDMKEVKNSLVDYKVKLKGIDESTKSAHKRIDEIGEIPQTVLRISIAVENIAEEVKELTMGIKENQKEINERLSNLEKAPGENAYQFQKQIILYIVMTIIGVALGKWGIK